MNPSARLQAVLDLLDTIEKTPRPADALVSGYFRARRYIGSKDRAAIATTTYDILRHRARLSWWIEKCWEDGSQTINLSSSGTNPPPNLPRKGGGVTPVLSEMESHNTQQGRSGPPPLAGGVRGGGVSANTEASSSATVSPRLLLLTYLALVERTAFKIIMELFSGGKYAPAAPSDDERALLKKLDGHTINHPDMPDGTKVECPDWALIPLQNRFGKTFLREMGALLKPAPLDLRVNPLKSTRDDILDELKNARAKAEPCRYSSLGVRIQERPSLSSLPMLKNGAAEIQDEGSQLVALIVDAKPGERVVDFCAGAGGKTLAIAAQMKNKGRIVACDVLEGRLKRSTERFRRAGFHNIETHPLKNENDPWVKKHKQSYDRVLVDAPCSGAGAWRRNPDARWRSLGPGLSALIPLQASILESAARLVKKGGRLVYATCSLLPEENEQQVEKFLEAHKDFRLIPLSEVWQQAQNCPPPLAGGVRGGGPQPVEELQNNPPSPDPYLSLTPAQHSTDGFFAAVMERVVNQ